MEGWKLLFILLSLLVIPLLLPKNTKPSLYLSILKASTFCSSSSHNGHRACSVCFPASYFQCPLLILCSLRLGSVAPNFDAETSTGPINFHEFIGNNWVVLFSHPDDFTPICTTELGAFAKLEPEFNAIGVKLIGLVSILFCVAI